MASRLTALEQAMADPQRHGSLESLILDLARIATEEADATARHAVLEAQMTGEKATARALAEVNQSLEVEKVESAALLEIIEDAKLGLKQAEAMLTEERRTTETANREAAGAHRELAAIRVSLAQEQAAGTSLRRALDAALADAEAGRARVSSVDEQMGLARAHGESERTALAGELSEQRAALEDERASSAQLRQTNSELERLLGAVRGELSESRTDLETTGRDLDNMRGELDATRRELDSVREDSAARTETLSHAQAEHEQALRAAYDAARSGEARLEQANLDRDAAQEERAELERLLGAVRGELSESRTELDAARRDLDNMRGELDATRRELDSVREDSAARTETLSHSQAEQEQALKAAHDAARSGEARLEQANLDRDAAQEERAELERRLGAVRGELSESSTELDAARRDLDTVRGELDATRRELGSVREDAATRTETLSYSQAEQEQALRAASDAARSGEARFEQVNHERDAAQHESAELRRQLELAESTILERDVALRQLQAAHEARDAAEVLEAVRHEQAAGEAELDSETVIDLTSITQEEERQLAIEQRTRALELALRDAEVRAQSAELELDRHRQRASGDPPAVVEPPLPAPPMAEAAEQFRGPSRGAKRVGFKPEPDIQIDGTPAKLVDLSLTGAQVLTQSAINPNRLVRVTLPTDDSMIACKAKVMWSRLEPRSGQLWYRAGVAFMNADQSALEAFTAVHQT